MKPKVLSLICKNNKYRDFGSHTGFRYVDCTHKFLEVGKCYSLILNSYGSYDLYTIERDISSGKTHTIDHNFHIFEEDTHSIYNNLYFFFHGIEKTRDYKFKKI